MITRGEGAGNRVGSPVPAPEKTEEPQEETPVLSPRPLTPRGVRRERIQERTEEKKKIVSLEMN